MAEPAKQNLDETKMEYDQDDEELIDFKLLEAAEEIFFASDDDPLLVLTPIVYTTKLDDMRTVKMNMTHLNANDILQNLHAESLPKVSNEKNIKKRAQNPNISPTFKVVSRVVSDINLKAAKLRKVSVSTSELSSDGDIKPVVDDIKPVVDDIQPVVDDIQPVVEDIQPVVHDTKQAIKCKPCSVVLKDIKYLMKNKMLFNLLTTSYQAEKVLDKLKTENVPENNTLENNLDVKFEITVEEIDVAEEDINSKNDVTESEAANHHRANMPQNKENETNKDDTVQKNKPKKRTHNYEDDSDDENIPLHVIKRKAPTTTTKTKIDKIMPTKLVNNKSVPAGVAHHSTNPVFTVSPEKYTIIVLSNQNDTHIYRVNATKLVTNYFKIKKLNNDMALASMFPREEKIVEQYCCWHQREDIISKICSRKNYPFSLQKFLKQPHDCAYDDCRCCCRKQGADENNKQEERRLVLEKCLQTANDWIQNLLGKNTSNVGGLVSQALAYDSTKPKQNTKKKDEKYLSNVLLCIDICNNQCEIYDIGNNGDVQRTLLLDSNEQVEQCQKSYQLSAKGVIKNATICCWFRREKLMQDLRMIKASPAVLRQIQKAHSCARRICYCCCKPKTDKFELTKAIPAVLQHTASYDKTGRKINISFNVTTPRLTSNKSKATQPLYNKIQKTTDASTAAAVLSECALKNNNPALSTNILSKFKNLQFGVSSLGTLEVILDAPAKTLSVNDLKDLSHAISLSTKHMADLGLTAVDFCTRLRTKGPPQTKSSEGTVLRTVESATIEDSNYGSDYNDVTDHVENDDTIAEETLTTTTNPSASSHQNYTDNTSTCRTTTQNLLKETPANVYSTVSYKPKGKSVASLLSALSGIMQTKSQCYVDSFKSYFQKSDSVVPLPELHKIFILQESSNEFDEVTDVPLSLPVIKETFTLSTHTAESRLLNQNLNTTLDDSLVQVNKEAQLNFNNLQNNNVTNTTDSTAKLRVKPVSELIASNPPPTIDNEMPSTSEWPVPALVTLDSDPQTSASVVSTATLTVGSNMQNETFIIPKDTPIGTTFKLIRKPLSCSKNSNDGSVGSSTNSGTHYLALMPVSAPNSISNLKNVQVVRPISNLRQPVPLVGNAVPKLVPIQQPSSSATQISTRGRKKNMKNN